MRTASRSRKVLPPSWGSHKETEGEKGPVGHLCTGKNFTFLPKCCVEEREQSGEVSLDLSESWGSYDSWLPLSLLPHLGELTARPWWEGKFLINGNNQEQNVAWCLT